MSNRKAKRYTDQYYPPTPTKSVLFWRSFIPYQAIRFVVLNYKIIKIVAGGHS